MKIGFWRWEYFVKEYLRIEMGSMTSEKVLVTRQQLIISRVCFVGNSL